MGRPHETGVTSFGHFQPPRIVAGILHFGYLSRYLIRRYARGRGLLDPLRLLASLDGFARPAEVGVPWELLRAGVAFHARGLLNARAIQGNLDWVWPFWVQRQFDPADPAFLPRAFSLTHVNLTHRNWTAVGLPDVTALPIVDPRGLVTPFLDGWSLDWWLVDENGFALYPSRCADCHQVLLQEADGLAVRTRCAQGEATIETRVWVEFVAGTPVCRVRCEARNPAPCWLVAALRPCNPEGLSLVSDICLQEGREWRIDRTAHCRFDQDSDRHHASSYWDGDVANRLFDDAQQTSIQDRVGMATAAAMFRVAEGYRRVELGIDLADDPGSRPLMPRQKPGEWAAALAPTAECRIPDARMCELYGAAVRTLLLHTPGEVWPGPYTYKRFWFRDAVFILHALLCCGQVERAGRLLAEFPARQRFGGYFHSQEGEWDANGQVLWLLDRYRRLSGEDLADTWRRPVASAADWIRRKRQPQDGSPTAGLLPAGFSAEHLGNNDHYLWDDYWSVAGLRAAAELFTAWGDAEAAQRWTAEADDLAACIEESLRQTVAIRRYHALPAAPQRRMDAGAVGSLCAGYPLGLLPADDPRLLATVDWLQDHCFVGGGFFQEMIHSGINAYLTLHMAQVLLRAGDPRYRQLLRTVADLASPTGQWPEAINPRTGGGCMGDGQHAWAAAEWILILRNAFVREEGDRLILASGLLPEWRNSTRPLRFGPSPTPFGPVRVDIEAIAGGLRVSWEGDWRGTPPRIEVAPPGCDPHLVTDSAVQSVELCFRTSEEEPA